MKRKRRVSYYPAFLDVSDRRCVVVGGGPVALRKVRALLERGASVEVISPEPCSELSQLAESGQVCISPRQYEEGDLEGAFMAIAATDDRITNLTVAKEARSKGVLVNVVDDDRSSDFIVPACVCRGDVTIAVSTGGRSPALAGKIRQRLEEEFGEEYASLALLVGEVRTEVRRQRIKVDSDAWKEALDLDSLIDLLKKGDGEKAKAILLNRLRAQRE